MLNRLFQRMLVRIDPYLIRIEKWGLNMANRAHSFSLKVIWAFMAYTLYSFCRDYNAIFREERVQFYFRYI